MATIYDVTEFATSVKPWLLQLLLSRGLPSVLYLDPDIVVYDRLDELFRHSISHGITVTPHALAPYPDDGKMTDERSILAAGIYNLGFIGVGQSSDAFLEFWKERLRRECVNDPAHMRFVDQRYVDLVPAMFGCVIERDPRWNAAYWNLHERQLEFTNSRYEVNGLPLGFFHFSGYSPRRPYELSKHQIDRPRILLSEHPALARLCDDYASRLLGCGFGVADGADGGGEYGFNKSSNGVPITKFIRSRYRQVLLAAEDTSTPLRRGDAATPHAPPDPFDPSQAEEFLSWLNRPPQAEGQGPNRLSHYQATLYSSQEFEQLRGRFPDPQGADFDAFQQWFENEITAGRIHPLLRPEPLPREALTPQPATGPGGLLEVRQSAGSWAPPDALVPGINIAGYLRAELGIGEGARLTVSAVAASDIPHVTVVYDATLSRQEHPFDIAGTEQRRDFDVNVVAVNADQFTHFAHQVGPEFFAGRYTIGQWAWELEEFPEIWRPAIDLVDEIWAISEFTRKSISAVTDKPVFAFPLPIVEPVVQPGVGRSDLGIPEGFMFLFCFDLLSNIERKNPLGVIEAFSKAFAPGEGPILVLKVVNGDTRVMDRERILMAAAGRDDIILLDQFLSVGKLGALMDTADCYVSLHRSEGFGLTMAEAMALGKPVIATAYSANLEYMDNDNSFLVPFTYGTVPANCDPYPVGSRWAEPDLGVAAEHMRTVVSDPARARAVGQRARLHVLENHSSTKRAEFVKSRFEAIQKMRASQAASTPRPPASPPLRVFAGKVRRRLGHLILGD
jgi:glycosyltransferase involved in cell wall biosynthesis